MSSANLPERPQDLVFSTRMSTRLPANRTKDQEELDFQKSFPNVEWTKEGADAETGAPRWRGRLPFRKKVHARVAVLVVCSDTQQACCYVTRS